MKLLVTGGAGFIGCNFIKYLINKYNKYQIFNVDLLTYAGNLSNLLDIKASEHTFVYGDIAEYKYIENVFPKDIDAIVNFAAESHVDRSIEDSGIFIRTNVEGTRVLLETARRHGVKKFLQVSTDEVYGSLGLEGYFTEDTPLAPNSPYSASKAAADLLVLAYHRTYRLPINITRCSNNYGPYQFPEKFIPLIITNALEDKSLPVYGNGLNIRDWLHVWDHCAALDLVLHEGKPGEVYNIGGNNERTNIEIVRKILSELGKQDSLITYVKDRPGHDCRYAIDASKIKKELGWEPKINFDSGLRKTIDWYCTNRDWWEKIKSGEYRQYYERMYSHR